MLRTAFCPTMVRMHLCHMLTSLKYYYLAFLENVCLPQDLAPIFYIQHSPM